MVSCNTAVEQSWLCNSGWGAELSGGCNMAVEQLSVTVAVEQVSITWLWNSQWGVE